ncbi:MAG: glutathione S-transferase family protein [Rhodospirillales bacterium]|nr:glutathione S-transferase family protein [Rhodospirillales bacterium]MDE2198944.1 glutathione S-transferase family protein [Rhodospirillales bacterium]MDE2575052.1 glutathione S-transferase family protein [Rhodospirillales bacterium]
MYTLHIGNKNYSSWSLRPWVLMRTLGIGFAERLVPFGAGADFHAFSPTGKVPCLVDGAITVWDSLAITEYLAERHPGIWPRENAARAWARCAAAEMHSGFATLREICTHNCGLRIRLHDQPAALWADIARFSALWREGLERFGGPFLAGADFTAADAFYAPVAFRAQTYGLALDPVADAYAQRLRDLPAMRDWYAAGLAETWREPGHEEEARRAGTWTEDLRATP